MKSKGYDLLLGGLFLALALLFPVLFHAIGLGSAFLPMFIPLLLAGLLCELPVALFVGFSAPLLSALLTGMPPFYPPVAPIMMAEGVVMAFIAHWTTRKKRCNTMIGLILALVADRLVLLGSVILAAKAMALPPGMLGVASVLRGIPGIALVLVTVPPLAVWLFKQKKEVEIFQ